MRLSNREKILLSLLVWTILIYSFYHFFYFPLNQKVTILVEQNNSLHQELVSAKLLSKKQNVVNSRHNKYQIELAELEVQVPCSPCIPEVIAFLEDTSQKSKAILRGINYRDKTQDEVNKSNRVRDTIANSLDFDVMAAGSYYDLVTFLKYIEKAPRVYTFNHIKLVAVPRKEETVTEDVAGLSTLPQPELKGRERFDGNNLLMTVNLNTYFYNGMSATAKVNVNKKVKPVQTGRDNPFNL